MMEYPTNWQEKDNFLVRTFEFDNFIQAVEFVNKIAPLAEQQGHHPDIEIFSYNKVKVKLTTHDKGSKITQKDILLAKKIDNIDI
jgi:4a-hydroxytetrahydrobiopterin dehydratase